MTTPKDYKDELKKKLAAMKKADEQAGKGPALKPLPRTMSRRPDVPRAPERPRSDEELFLEAVQGVDQDAVLKKYDETPPAPARAKPPEETKREEQALFESFVGSLDKKL